MSAVPAAAVKTYLQRQGIPRDIVEWKYFDERFNRRKERGYVLLRDGEVTGFLGAIPFCMRIGPDTVQTAWTCDWSATAEAGAAGILLIRQMLCSYDPYFQHGGNDNTLRIMPRVAAFTARDAGILMYLPLRLGSLLRLARRVAPRVPLDGSKVLNRLPLPRALRQGEYGKAGIEDGVSPALAPVLSASCPGETFPHYDFEYVDWQIGRCPALDAITALAPGAAALCWRRKPGGAAWRMALWAEPGAEAGLDTVLCGALRHIYNSGAEIAYVLASKRDTALLALFARRGFRMAPRRRMFCAVAGAKGLHFEEPSGLSLLDADMAYRFE